MRTMRLIAALLLCIALRAEAATYEWIDKSGVVHMTDDPDKVPAEYIRRVKTLPSVKGAEPASTPAQNESAPQSTARQELLHGGHDEEWWRSSFKTINDELESLKEKLPGKKAEDEIFRRRWRVFSGGARERVEYYKRKEEIEKDEARIKELEEQLAALEESAVKAGVPSEWRK